MATSTFFPTAFPKYATTTATIHKHKRRPDFHSYTEMKFSSNPESKPKKQTKNIIIDTFCSTSARQYSSLNLLTQLGKD
jgi:hypothetical protein